MVADSFWLNPKKITLKDGTVVALRLEEQGDLEPVWMMFSTLSDESLQFLPIRFSRERVEGWFREINYDKTLPILGTVKDDAGERVVAASSLTFSQLEHNRHIASFGITVHDDYQGRGLGKKLTEYMIEIASAKGLKKITLEVVTRNQIAINLYRQHGFKIEGNHEMGHWNYILKRYGDDHTMGLILK